MILGPILLVCGLAGTLATILARSSGWLHVSDQSRRWLEYRHQRATYDDWIHVATLHESVDTLPECRAASLADLVDIAIDVDETVIESPDGTAFRVVHDGYYYTYKPPTPGDDGPSQSAGRDGTDTDNSSIDSAKQQRPADTTRSGSTDTTPAGDSSSTDTATDDKQGSPDDPSADGASSTNGDLEDEPSA